MLSKRTKNLKASPTLALLARARELAAQGNDVVALTVGEPDWATFPKIADAGIEAINKGITKYTPANGTAEIRKAILEKFKADFGLDYSIKEVTVASGAKFIIFAALQVLCDEGDEVIIGAPYWVSYPTMIELSGAKPVIVATDEKTQYKLLAAELEQNITDKTKIFLYCSPSNPTGKAYTREELEEIAEVLRKNPRVIVISDDMYNRLMLSGEYRSPHLLDVAPDLRHRIISVNGGSKAYSMTGWRIGWGVGPENIITAMTDYQSQSTGAASSISQHAAITAIKTSEPEILEVNKKLRSRCKMAIQEFSKIPELKVIVPDGAFYLWVDIQGVLGKKFKGATLKDSKEFCDILLEQFYVSIIPGNECGVEGFVRLSIAASEEQIIKAIGRMKDFVDQLN